MTPSLDPTHQRQATNSLPHRLHWLMMGLVFLLPTLVFGFSFSLRFAIPLALLLLGAA
ncbi:hypothetical protein MK280_20220 [Myxococcota bacterium]|nr:hypothetical protein [Myxococcota bacterium]